MRHVIHFSLASSILVCLLTAACGRVANNERTSSSPGAVGAACAFDNQCGTHQCSADQQAGQCGVCVEVRPLGASCTGENQACARSAVCSGGVCETLKKVAGEACTNGPKGGDEHECDDELYCAPDADSISEGHCKQRPAEGEACELYSACVTPAVCDSVSKTCVVPNPKACFGDEACADDEYCSSTNECAPASILKGNLCGLVSGEFIEGECEKGTVCGNLDYPNGGSGGSVDSTCLPTPKAGEPCITGACTEGTYCEEGDDGTALPMCQPLKEEGEACTWHTWDNECDVGLECRSDVCTAACE